MTTRIWRVTYSSSLGENHRVVIAETAEKAAQVAEARAKGQFPWWKAGRDFVSEVKLIEEAAESA